MDKKDFESIVQLMTEQWINLKEDLHNGLVEFDNLGELISKYMFFNRFDNVFKETCKFLEVNLSDINHMYRGVSEEIDLNYYERMVPKIEFAKGNNRMNPPGKAFLYVGVLGKDKGKDENTIKKHVVKTVLKEIRAAENSVVTICKFKINDSAKSKKVINICGDIGIPKSDAELSDYIYKHVYKHVVKGFTENKEKLSYIFANIYFNMFSSEPIFKPVNTNEQEVKKYEYAPFHALANYISEQGYAGLTFRSTVHQNGTNLVLFDPSDASVIQNSMEHINTSDYL